MKEMSVKVEPETHNDDTQQADTCTVDLRGITDKIEIEIHIKHEPVLKDEPISDEECSELIDDTRVCNGTESVEDSVDRLEVSSLESVNEQQVVPSGLRTDDVCVSGNSDCTRTVSVKEHAKCTASGNTYQCDVCHKCFNKKSNLNRHFLTHTGVKSYKCNTCDKAFSRPGDFRRHIRIHSGEKPYKCNICNKSFSQSGYLPIHIRTHTGDKPFKCSNCSLAFTSSCELNKHIHTHTGIKPYKCNKCNKTYSRTNHLRDHIRKTHC